MKKPIGKIIQKALIPIGVLLILSATIALIVWQSNISISENRAEQYVSEILSLIPQPQDSYPDPRRDNTMPTLLLDGVGFIGVIEIPRYASSLPIGGKWGKSNKYPCRFDGSIYDGTLQIGATSQKGQYDFYRALTLGDAVYLTDMEGNRYSLDITDLYYADHVDQASLSRTHAALTLFIKNIYGFEYLIVCCNVSE